MDPITRANLQRVGLEEPVMILPPVPSIQELLRQYIAQFEVEEHGSVALYTSRRDPAITYKVQIMSDGTVTSNDPSHGKSDTASTFVADFCIRRGLPIPGYFSLQRRLPPAELVFPDGQSTQKARRKRAYRGAHKRMREMLFELCQRIPKSARLSFQPERKHYAGRKCVPARVLIYCILMKVILAMSYDATRNIALENDPNLKALGWGFGPPHTDLLSQALGDEAVTSYIEEMIATTASFGVALDYAVVIDGSGHGTTMLRNWRGAKYPKRSNKKKNPEIETGDEQSQAAVKAKTLVDVLAFEPGETEEQRRRRIKGWNGYIKVHPAIGAISGLIYAMDVTYSVGQGAGDSWHLKPLLERAQGRFEIVLADKAYYDEENFDFAQRTNRMLFVLPRSTDTLDDLEHGRELGILLEYLRIEHPALYRRFYRLRSKIETSFSSQGRTNYWLRCRIRKHDIDRILGLRFDPYYIPPKSVKRNVREAWKRTCLMIASARVGTAHRNEALAVGLAMNLRQLCVLERLYGRDGAKVDFTARIPFPAKRRVSVPMKINVPAA